MNQSCSVRSSRSECVGLSTVYQNTWPTPVASGPSVGVTPVGQALRDEAHAFEHASPREVQIHVVLEDDVDHREAERGLRPDDAHTGEPLEVRGERVRDLVLDLLRAVPGQSVKTITWLSERSGIASIGVDVSAHQPQPARPRYSDDDDEPVFQCNVNESIDHEPQHSSCRARTRANLRAQTRSPSRHTTTANG